MHDYDEDLDGFLIENEEGRTYEGRDGWEPQNDADAEYALMRLARAHREIQRVEAAAEQKMDRIKAWQEAASMYFSERHSSLSVIGPWCASLTDSSSGDSS